jgi:hypothetical protein
MLFLQPADLPYMKTFGHNCDDWNIIPELGIEPELSSQCMQNLPRKAKQNKTKHEYALYRQYWQRFFKKS